MIEDRRLKILKIFVPTMGRAEILGILVRVTKLLNNSIDIILHVLIECL